MLIEPMDWLQLPHLHFMLNMENYQSLWSLYFITYRYVQY